MTVSTSFWKQPYTYLVVVVLIAFAALGYGFWVWVVERVEVTAGSSLIVTNKWGEELPEGAIIAPGPEYKGIQLEPRKEGRYFLNPIFYTHTIEPMVEVPAGQCLVVTRLFGKEIPEERLRTGDFLARGAIDDPDGERGILKEVLRPGKYRLNPHAFKWELKPAVNIATNEVGVRTLKVGKDPRELKDRNSTRLAGNVVGSGSGGVLNTLLAAGSALEDRSPYVVPEGYRGVQEQPVSSGDYYINPFVESIVPVQTRTHQVEFTDISFPTTDGFILNPKVDVTYQVVPEKAPMLYVLLTSEGELPQADNTPKEIAENQVLQKVVLPLIRGYMRIQGSKFQARDFISREDAPGNAQAVNARERLQQEVLDKVRPRCEEVGVQIYSITMGEPSNPASVRTAADEDFLELKDVIRDREQARVEMEQIQEDIKQMETLKDRKAKEALEEQKAQVGEANVKLEVATVKAQQRMEVTEKEFKQKLDNAQVRLDAAKEEAKAVLAQAQADADVIEKQNEAEVAGLKRAVQGFTSPDAFAQYQVLTKVAPALTEIFASDDSDFAKLFAKYMASPSGQPATTPVGTPMPPAGEK
jgi:regulator of protease activity HflC (stomatin/prohibitin superfamily)